MDRSIHSANMSPQSPRDETRNIGGSRVSFLVGEQKGSRTRRLVIQLPAGTLRVESGKHFWDSVSQNIQQRAAFSS